MIAAIAIPRNALKPVVSRLTTPIRILMAGKITPTIPTYGQALKQLIPRRRSIIPMMKAMTPKAAPRPPRPATLTMAPPIIANSPPIIQRIPRIVTPHGLSDIVVHSSGCTDVLPFKRKENTGISGIFLVGAVLVPGKSYR